MRKILIYLSKISIYKTRFMGYNEIKNAWRYLL